MPLPFALSLMVGGLVAQGAGQRWARMTLLGATGATELALSIRMMHESLVPKTLNCNEMDDFIWLDVVRDENREARIETFMSNSFGFGGHNAVLIARKYTE